MSEHTPGPWTFNYNGTIGHIKSVAEHPKGMTPTVARFDGHLIACTIHTEERLANAQLISAAPDLLEFAQQVAQVAKNHGNRFIEMWALSVCQQAGFPVTLKDEVTP